MEYTLKDLLRMMVEKKASDLHLKAGTPPVVRKNKSLALLSRELGFLNQKIIEELLKPVLKPYHRESLLTEKQVDFSYGVKDLGRFRFNIFFQRGTLRVVVRHIPYNIPGFETLGLPKKVQDIVNTTNEGLVLVTGATGNGKTTTIMAILDYINQCKNKHIITIEDPIEFLISDCKSLITQRELGTDYLDYKSALKSTLRQDPDIIFFGEIRCKDSLSTALTAANTGHLVFSTLHTKNTSETITRLLGFLGSERYFRLEFAACLESVICQKLIPKASENSFIPAVEILINNPRIRDILEDETKSTSLLPKIIEESQHGWGMQTFNQHLKELWDQKLITQETALQFSDSPEKLRMFFSGLSHNNSDDQQSSPSVEMPTKSNFTTDESSPDTSLASEPLALKEGSQVYKKAK